MRPARFFRRRSGFTLIEAMVVIAGLGIIAAVVIAKYQQMTVSPPPHNIARELVDVMERAKKTAAEKKIDVWVLMYPGFSRRSDSLSSGRGAFFVFEDQKRDFNATAKSGEGAVYYRPGVGIDFDPVARVVAGSNGKVTDSDYMEEYKSKIRFRVMNATLALGPAEAPFPPMPIKAACSFCSSGRGAVVFTPEGQFHFVDGEGDAVDNEQHTQTLALYTDGTRKASVVAMSSATGKIAAFQK